jgi:hypothetical protein
LQGILFLKDVPKLPLTVWNRIMYEMSKRYQVFPKHQEVEAPRSLLQGASNVGIHKRLRISPDSFRSWETS